MVSLSEPGQYLYPIDVIGTVVTLVSAAFGVIDSVRQMMKISNGPGSNLDSEKGESEP